MGPRTYVATLGYEKELSRRDKNRLLDSDPHMPGDEDRWHGAKYLGGGSYGAVGLWCKVDEHDNVIDRMVVKDHAAYSRTDWRDPKNWRDGLPREVAINRRIESRREAEPEACQYIVKYRGHRLLMEHRRFRLYTDFAAGGSFLDAAWPYSQRWQNIKPERVPTQVCLPEAFIWYTIKALATACLFLENGTLSDADNASMVDWKPIFHLDLQTPNILLNLQTKKRKTPDGEKSNAHLADPSKKSSAKAKREARLKNLEIVPQLADFGLSFFDLDFSGCSALDENPEAHIFHDGTQNRYAPEHHHYNPDSPKKLDTKSDVWGIGRIAWSLIVNQTDDYGGPVRENGFLDQVNGYPLHLSRNDDQNMQLDDQYNQQVLIGSDEWPAARRYSEELKELVRDCLKFYQENRPSPRVILHRVNQHLDANPHLKENAMDLLSKVLEFPETKGLELEGPFKRQRV